ncbi:MAG: ATP-binding protein [Sulfuricella sp.]
MKFSDSAPVRLIFLLLVVYALSAGLIFFFLDYQLTSTLTKGVDHTLSEERNLLQLQYRDSGTAGLYRAIKSEIESEGSQSHGFRILDQHKQITYQAGGLSLPLDKAFPGVRQMDVDASDGKKHPARVISFSLGDGMTAFTAVSMDPVFALVRKFHRTFLLTAGMVSLFGLGVGLWLARRFRARIDAFNRNTNLIMQSGDLSGRMPVSGNDELAVLAGNMNAMLERIERLVQGIRQVSDNIAHDLRTPLTRLSADVQVALQQEDAGMHHAALQRVHGELDKMQGVFNSLLAISWAESGGMPVKRAVVDFSGLLNELVELYEPSAEEHGLVLHGEVVEGLQIYGNRQLLAQTISNLLDNSLKYVPSGGEVRLSAQRQGDHVKVAVEDSGPGIPPEMCDKVFERFTRLDPSRTMAGSGLGLSLVKAFVELHHGRISISKSTLGGSAFLLDFPAA